MLLYICYIMDKVGRNTDLGWSKDPGPSLAGKFLAFFISWHGSVIAAKELSVFIDESGDFGVYDFRCPFYIITMVFHDQSVPIAEEIRKLNQELSYMNLHNLCIHTGPIIRREEIYEYMDLSDRRRIFNKMVAFFRQVNIRYKCFSIEKKHIDDAVIASAQLSKKISQFIRDHYADCLDSEVQELLAKGINPLAFPGLCLSETSDESKAINADPTPKVIISASGMCEAGRIKHHLKHNLWRKESTILFVGYQAEGSLGRALIEGEKEVTLFGEEIKVEDIKYSISFCIDFKFIELPLAFLFQYRHGAFQVNI